jgi:hypothetical protein
MRAVLAPMSTTPSSQSSPTKATPGDRIRLALVCALALAPSAFAYRWTFRWDRVSHYWDIRWFAIPVLHWTQTRLHSWHFPLLAPMYGGYPLYADPQSLVFYPPAFLAGFLPTLTAFQALTIFHLVAAFAGCYALGRQLRLDTASSLVIGTLWTGSAFFAGTSFRWASMLYALAWWPWVLWSLLRLDAGVNAGRFAAAVGLGALEILAGHPQMTVYFALLWLAWLMIGPLDHRKRTAMASAAVGLTAIALTAYAWLPWGMLTGQTARAAPTEAFVRSYGLPLPWLLSTIRTYFGLGAAAIALAVAGSWHRRRFTIGIMALAALFMTWSYGNPLYHVIAHVPLLNQFRGAFRYIAVTVFLLSILAGYGLELLRRKGWLQVAALALVALELVYVTPRSQPRLIPAKGFMREPASARALRCGPPGSFFLFTHQVMGPVPGTRVNGGPFPFRLASNENLLWNAASVQGYTPLEPARQVRFLRLYAGQSVGGIPIQPDVRGRLCELQRLGCRYILSTMALSELSKRPVSRLPDGMLLYDLGPAPTAILTRGGEIRSARAGDQWREVEGVFPQRQKVIFTVGYWPEWRAQIDGRECEVVADGPNPAVEVPRGAHRVRIEYVPASLYGGLAVSLASLLVLGAGFVIARRRFPKMTASGGPKGRVSRPRCSGA